MSEAAIHPAAQKAFDLIQAAHRMNLQEFTAAYEAAQKTDMAEFPWKRVFREIACQGNAQKLAYLKQKHHPDKELLTETLLAVIENGDRIAVAHRLREWGADTKKAIGLSFSRERPRIFKDLVLWTDKIEDGEDFFRACLDKIHRDAPQKPKHGHGSVRDYLKKMDLQDSFRDTARIFAVKKKLRGKWGPGLRKAFKKAVDEGLHLTLIAAYAESRQERTFRGIVDLGRKDPHLPGDAILMMLRKDHAMTALRMTEDGYDPESASPAARADFDKSAKPGQKDHLVKLIEHYKKGEDLRLTEYKRKACEAAALTSINTPRL